MHHQLKYIWLLSNNPFSHPLISFGLDDYKTLESCAVLRARDGRCSVRVSAKVLCVRECAGATLVTAGDVCVILRVRECASAACA